MATKLFNLVDGTTAYGSEVDDNFDELFTNIDSSNVAGANKTGSGKFVLDTSPTISSLTLSGSLSGSLSGTFSYSQTSSATTSNAMSITADSLTTGSGIAVTSNSSSASTRYLANIVNDHASATGATVLRLQQDSTGGLISAIGSGASTVFSVDYMGTTSITSPVTTGNAFNVSADSISTGSGVYIYSNSSSASTRYLTNIVNDHASAAGTTVLRLQQDAAGNLMTGIGAAGATVYTLTYTGAASFSDTVTISPTKKFHLDGGGDTYEIESSANVKDTYVGGNKWISIDNPSNYVTFRKDVDNYAVFDFYNLNNTSNAYVRNALVVGGSSAADPYTMWQVSGQMSYSLGIDNSDSDKLKLTTDPSGSTPSSGTTIMTINSSGEMLLPSVSTPTANYANRQSFIKAWGYCSISGTSSGSATGYNIASASVSSYECTVTFTTPMADTSYAVAATPVTGSGTTGAFTVECRDKTTTTVTLKAIKTDGTGGVYGAASHVYSFMICGNQ